MVPLLQIPVRVRPSLSYGVTCVKPGFSTFDSGLPMMFEGPVGFLLMSWA